jgi:pimeloyl-ACP methyl ester carboxylesterase
VTLYFISGLGVDRRAFTRLQFPDDFKIRHLDWIAPLADETLPAYAKRLARNINTKEAFSLVGLSFGGMVATEIALNVPPKHLILLSSASAITEVPQLYKLIGSIKLHKVIPTALLKQPTFFTYWFFDAVKKDEKQLLKAILKDTSPAFLRWAIDSVLQWRNKKRPDNLYHIHGSKDKILPLSNVKADKIVNGAGHFMVFSHGPLLSKLILERLLYTDRDIKINT